MFPPSNGPRPIQGATPPPTAANAPPPPNPAQPHAPPAEVPPGSRAAVLTNLQTISQVTRDLERQVGHVLSDASLSDEVPGPVENRIRKALDMITQGSDGLDDALALLTGAAEGDGEDDEADDDPKADPKGGK